MRFRPANIRLINRRLNLPRLLLALSSKRDKNNYNHKSKLTDVQGLTGSLHIRPLVEMARSMAFRPGPWSHSCFILPGEFFHNP